MATNLKTEDSEKVDENGNILNTVGLLEDQNSFKPDVKPSETKRYSLIDVRNEDFIFPAEPISPQSSGASKTELSSLLSGSSLKKPANINAVILWQYQAKHPTDLDVEKGERVKILHKNGDLAFVENRKTQQGFVPLGYCSLYRRRSSSLSDLSTDLAKKLSSQEANETTETKVTDSQLVVSLNGHQIKVKESDESKKKKKRFDKMFSRGTYDARGAENRSKKKNEKGVFNNAAKKLMRAFTSSLPSKSKPKPKITEKEKRPLPTWLTELYFDNSNPDYSSSSDSSDDDGDSAYESFRRGYEKRPSSRRRRGSMNSIATHSSFVSTQDDLSQSRRSVNESFRLSDDIKPEYAQDIVTGFANVRKLKTKSLTTGKGVSRSLSFNLDAKTRTMQSVWRQKPNDLLDEPCQSQNREKESTTVGFATEDVSPRLRSKSEQTEGENFMKNNNMMVVLSDFVTTDSKDLDVVAGQAVWVLNKNNGNWWLCETEDGRAGFVPRVCLTTEDCNEALYMQESLLSSNIGRNDCQDWIFKTKAASVKLARITPMAREPLLDQFKPPSLMKHGADGSIRLSINDIEDADIEQKCELEHDDYDREYKNSSSLAYTHQNSLSQEKLDELSMDSKNLAARQMEVTMSVKEQRQFNSEPDTEVSTWHSEHGETELKSEAAKHDLEIQGTDEAEIAEYKARAPGLEIEKDIEKNDSKTEETMGLRPNSVSFDEKIIPQTLPSYNETIERRNITNLTARINQISVDIEKAINERSHSTLIDKLLEEWRDEQHLTTEKRLVSAQATTPEQRQATTPEHRPALERRTSSDSQSTLDSIDTAPRVLRRRNSMNRRVRFQTPEVSEESNKNGSRTHVAPKRTDQPVLATWL